MGTTHQPTVWQLIVNQPYEGITWIEEYLKGHCTSVLGAEHDGTKRVHCHFMLVDPDCTTQAIQKALNKNGVKGSDMYSLLTVTKEDKVAYDENKLAIYILKGGNKSTVKVSTYSQEQIDKWISEWVLFCTRKEEKVKDEKGDYNEWKKIKADWDKLDNPIATLDAIRTWTMRWYWKRDGRMPHATVYKRNAASLYVYATEQRINLMGTQGGCMDAAFEELKNLWY